MKLNVNNETGFLRSVVLGIGKSIGEPSGNNPKSRYFLDNGDFPTEKDIKAEIAQFEKVLLANDVKIFRPKNLEDCCQIFTRDIGFVIGDSFFASAMVESREREIQGIEGLKSKLPNYFDVKKESGSSTIRIEGGDVMLWDDYILVGKSKRTNDEGFEFIKNRFKDKKVVQIPVKVSTDHKDNVLHLDCTLQPIGMNHLILYRDGLNDLYSVETLIEVLKDKGIPFENVIEVSQSQSYRMFPNILSISETKIVIERKFIELKYKLKHAGFEVIEVDYAETSKLSGLLRCSTLPLNRL